MAYRRLVICAQMWLRTRVIQKVNLSFPPHSERPINEYHARDAPYSHIASSVSTTVQISWLDGPPTSEHWGFLSYLQAIQQPNSRLPLLQVVAVSHLGIAQGFVMSYECNFEEDPLNSQTTAATRTKVINDPIHGHFELPPHVVQIIDTPHVQRLRDLKQLGGTYLVYPGASHNRFEHSLGVSHLSHYFVNTLHTNTRDPHASLLFENQSHFQSCLKLVELAGLAHDLGHGPFSHMFDNVFLPAVCKARAVEGGELMHHEARSVRLFEHCVNEHHIDLDRESVRAIGDLIRGRKNTSSTLVPKFLFDVVANSDTGIDTDKFDYLARDTYNIGLKNSYGFDHRRLMKFAKVISDSICFHRKEIFNVHHLFLTRFQLHRTVYNHRAALAIDAMITDAFLEADRVFNIFDSINDPHEFLLTTDSLVSLIERSKEPSLAKARDIFRRLRTRKLYRIVEEALLPAGCTRKITELDIMNAQTSGPSISADEIHVANVTLNFGMRRQNPVDSVKFFKYWDDTNPVSIPSTKVSYVIPVHFEERLVRVFMKSNDEAMRQTVSHAFRNYMQSQNMGASLPSPVLSHRAIRSLNIEPVELEESASSRLAKRMRPNGMGGS